MRSLQKSLSYFLSFSFGLLIILNSGFTNSVLAIEYGGIGGRPAYPRADTPRSESIFIHNIVEGQTIEEGLKVINNTNEQKTLIIYATDETPSTDGGFACKQFAEEQAHVGSWIKLTKTELTLKPQSYEIVPFTINIPASVDVGEHNGCMVIQEKKLETTEAGLNLAIRTALRVALTLPGEIIRQLSLVNFEVIEKDSETYNFKPTVSNTGNVSIDTDIKVYLKDVFNRDLVEYGGKYSVFKNNPLSLNFEYHKFFWGGLYSAQSVVTYNDGEKDILLTSDIETFFSFPHQNAIIIEFIVLSSFLILIRVKFVKNKKAKVTFRKKKSTRPN